MNKYYKIKLSFFEEENPFYTIIENDFYNIAKRIKEIDDTLVLIFNNMQNQFEVHDLRNTHNTFIISFDELDRKIVDVLNKAKGRDTIGFIKSETIKRDRFAKLKDDLRKMDNKKFLTKTQIETIVR